MIDKLIEDILEKKNPSVVGLDPTPEMMPDFLKAKYFERMGMSAAAYAGMFLEFNRAVIDAVYEIVPAVKPQIAMYERFGIPGLQAYNATCEYAQGRGLTVIGDIKRGDISSTALAYAAHLGGVIINGEHQDTWSEDAVTVNPYLGTDGIKPFLNQCDAYKKGIFILVRTSNPSSAEIQEQELADGRRLFEAVGDLTEKWGEYLIGGHGYSEVGAVVGATHREQGELLRKRMPHTFFLVPGYGAQGGKADDVAGFFDEKGLGAIISSSRGITAAYKKDPKYGEKDYAQAAADAAVRMREDLAAALNRKGITY